MDGESEVYIQRKLSDGQSVLLHTILGVKIDNPWNFQCFLVVK